MMAHGVSQKVCSHFWQRSAFSLGSTWVGPRVRVRARVRVRVRVRVRGQGRGQGKAQG